MAEYTTLIKVNDGDLDTPTIFGRLTRSQSDEEYYLPSPLQPLLEKGLDALAQEDRQPLITACQVIDQWWKRYHPDGHLLVLSHYVRARGIHLSHENDEQLSHFIVTDLNPGQNQKVLYEIGVSGLAAFLLDPERPDALDQLGDHFFGELNWQQLKQWLNMLDEDTGA